MAKWKHVYIHSNMIRRYTDKAVLIAMPHKSNYSGYVFWHPLKCLIETRLAYTDEFTFRLKKYGRGKYNKFEVIAQTEIDAEEFGEALAAMAYWEPEDDEPKIHTPDPLEPEHAEALPELRDD